MDIKRFSDFNIVGQDLCCETCGCDLEFCGEYLSYPPLDEVFTETFKCSNERCPGDKEYVEVDVILHTPLLQILRKSEVE